MHNSHAYNRERKKWEENDRVGSKEYNAANHIGYITISFFVAYLVTNSIEDIPEQNSNSDIIGDAADITGDEEKEECKQPGMANVDF